MFLLAVNFLSIVVCFLYATVLCLRPESHDQIFVQFVCIYIFGAITPRSYFLVQLLARRKCLDVSTKKLLKFSPTVFHSERFFAVSKESLLNLPLQ